MAAIADDIRLLDPAIALGQTIVVASDCYILDMALMAGICLPADVVEIALPVLLNW